MSLLWHVTLVPRRPVRTARNWTVYQAPARTTLCGAPITTFDMRPKDARVCYRTGFDPHGYTACPACKSLLEKHTEANA